MYWIEVLIIEGFFLVVVVFSIISIQIVVAADVNEEYKQHRQNIVLNEMKVNSKWLNYISKQEDLLDRGYTMDSSEFKEIEKEKILLEECIKGLKRAVEGTLMFCPPPPLSFQNICLCSLLCNHYFASKFSI